MTLTWVICGAGRGVGKTRLAQHLCNLLPNPVYVKHGCGKPVPSKPPNLFASEEEVASFIDASCDEYEHIILESNTWARKGQGDVIILVEGDPSQTTIRPDVELLRAAAHLHFGLESSIAEWREVLRNKLSEPLCDTICDMLANLSRKNTGS